MALTGDYQALKDEIRRLYAQDRCRLGRTAGEDKLFIEIPLNRLSSDLAPLKERALGILQRAASEFGTNGHAAGRHLWQRDDMLRCEGDGLIRALFDIDVPPALYEKQEREPSDPYKKIQALWKTFRQSRLVRLEDGQHCLIAPAELTWQDVRACLRSGRVPAPTEEEMPLATRNMPLPRGYQALNLSSQLAHTLAGQIDTLVADNLAAALPPRQAEEQEGRRRRKREERFLYGSFIATPPGESDPSFFMCIPRPGYRPWIEMLRQKLGDPSLQPAHPPNKHLRQCAGGDFMQVRLSQQQAVALISLDGIHVMNGGDRMDQSVFTREVMHFAAYQQNRFPDRDR